MGEHITEARGERFNPQGINGRDCPVCYRVGSLTGERADGAQLRCSGCFTRFRLYRVSTISPLFDILERVREPRQVARPEFDPSRGDEWDLLFGEQSNAGARMADDRFCPGCGARGHISLCSDCARR